MAEQDTQEHERRQQEARQQQDAEARRRRELEVGPDRDIQRPDEESLRQRPRR